MTVLNALSSLVEQGVLSGRKLVWYGCIRRVNPAGTYRTSGIDDGTPAVGCGFACETGPIAFKGLLETPIHLSSDVGPRRLPSVCSGPGFAREEIGGLCTRDTHGSSGLTQRWGFSPSS